MIRTKKDGDLIIISGPTAVGKHTVIQKLLSEEFVLSVSATSRLPREGEVEGVDYYYVTKEEFRKKIENEEFLEYAVVHGDNYYGTLKSDVNNKLKTGKNVILEIDIAGAVTIKEKYPNAIFIFLLPPSVEEIKNRILGRNSETKEQIMKRFTTMYKEINEINKYNYVVINDEVDLAVSKINAILLSEKCRVDRIEELVIDTKEEEIHEQIIAHFDNL